MARSLTVLNDGGHFLRMDNGYKGAAIQFKNMYDNPLISGTTQALGGAIGGGIAYGMGGGGAVGAAAAPFGAAYGRSVAAGKLERAAARSAARKGQESLRPISEVLTSLQKKK
jgi:hypothetical protein